MHKKNILILSLCLTFLLGLKGYADNNKNQFPLPGKTLANTKLQYDTLMSAQIAAGTVVKNCKSFTVINTEVLQQPKDLVVKNNAYVGGNWREKWTINACGINVYVPITFLMDNTGASYIIRENEVYRK